MCFLYEYIIINEVILDETFEINHDIMLHIYKNIIKFHKII